MIFRGVVLGLVLVSAGIGGISRTDASSPPPATQPLLVYCAAGLRPPMEELARRFERGTGRRVRFHFTGSACLMPQAQLTERGDVFCPAERFYMDQAVERGLVHEWREIARFTPVIAVAKGNPKRIRTLEDLTRADVKVGLADPKAAAVGKTAKTLLEVRGIWPRVTPRVATYAATVNELGNALKIGGVDAGIIWDAVASWYPDDLEAVAIPDADRWSAEICVGVLNHTSQATAARAWCEFLGSETGRNVFQTYGFRVPLNVRTGPPRAR